MSWNSKIKTLSNLHNDNTLSHSTKNVLRFFSWVITIKKEVSFSPQKQWRQPIITGCRSNPSPSSGKQNCRLQDIVGTACFTSKSDTDRKGRELRPIVIRARRLTTFIKSSKKVGGGGGGAK